VGLLPVRLGGTLKLLGWVVLALLLPLRLEAQTCTPAHPGWRCIAWTWPLLDSNGAIEMGQVQAVAYMRADTLGAAWEELFRTSFRYHHGEPAAYSFPEWILGEVRPRRYYLELWDRSDNISDPSNEALYVP